MSRSKSKQQRQQNSKQQRREQQAASSKQQQTAASSGKQQAASSGGTTHLRKDELKELLLDSALVDAILPRELHFERLLEVILPHAHLKQRVMSQVRSAIRGGQQCNQSVHMALVGT